VIMQTETHIFTRFMNTCNYSCIDSVLIAHCAVTSTSIYLARSQSGLRSSQSHLSVGSVALKYESYFVLPLWLFLTSCSTDRVSRPVHTIFHSQYFIDALWAIGCCVMPFVQVLLPSSVPLTSPNVDFGYVSA